MPNLTTGFPKRTGNMEKDYGNIYNWSISLVDELKYILCNLDAGNVTEANSVKAHHIDCSQARIKGAQIQSLTADKLTAGTIDAKEIIVKNIDADNINTGTLNSGLVNIENSDSLGKVTLDGDSLIFYEKIDGELYPRIALGRDEDGKYIFTVQNILAAKGLTADENGNTAQGIYMDSDGNIYITGHFTGGSISSDTTIDVNTDATIGQRLVLKDRDASTTGSKEAAIISVNTGVMRINANNNRSIELSTDGNINFKSGNIISMTCDNSSGRPDLKVNNKRILVKDDYDTLLDKIEALQRTVNSIQSQMNN